MFGKQCTYDSNNNFELDQVEGNDDKHNYGSLFHHFAF
jgi:hypothetical protein